MYLINSFARPYFDDPEAVAEEIRDLRIRSVFTESIWISVTAIEGELIYGGTGQRLGGPRQTEAWLKSDRAPRRLG